MSKSITILRTLLLVVLLTCGGAVAASDRFSIQLGTNHSTADTVFIGGQPVGAPPPELSSRSSFSGSTLRVGATVRVYRWLHLDAGWAEFGDEDRFTSIFSGPACIGPCPPEIPPYIVDNVEQSGSGFYLALAPTFEHGPWRLIGKIGRARTTIASQQAGDSTNRLEMTETGTMYGVGAGYYFTEHLGLRFDFEQLGNEARQLGLSLTLRF